MTKTTIYQCEDCSALVAADFDRPPLWMSQPVVGDGYAADPLTAQTEPLCSDHCSLEPLTPVQPEAAD